ncbi:MAG: molybdenum cofactor biosynthesis protein MoaE [Nitrospirae bacterium]|nr:molybdenum cofactor biosynthesis protein MoaE [Nitrospirota bacterium]
MGIRPYLASGGANGRRPVKFLTRDPIETEPYLAKVAGEDFGGTAAFIGTVRSLNEGRRVVSITFEAAEPLAETALQRIYEAMRARLAGGQAALIHRVGEVKVGEIAVLIAASSAHRREAFDAVREAIETLKASVPIWKKEQYADGTSAWLDGCALEPPTHPGEEPHVRHQR